MVRGQRYPWLCLLALVAAVLASGQQTGHAVAHWVGLHAEELHEWLRPARASTPGEPTLHRARRGLDISLLEQRLASHAQCPAPLAALLNAILNLFRQHGWANIAGVFRPQAASGQRTLDLIGVAPT